jgi:putative ATP-dependent endonuclease of OLD family
MAAELLLLEQEAENEFPLLLIEEPEAHLHPQLQMKLLQFINSKVKSDTNPEGIQCILTTHSPNLSSKADPSEVIMMNSGRAWPLNPDETELDSGDYMYLRKFLDATKANVFYAKGILFVEGDTENILLPEIARLLGRPLENYGVSIVKYDNSGSWKRFAKLFLRPDKDDDSEAWLTTRVCILRDLDLWPDCAEEKDDGSNQYGFKKQNNRNQRYWRRNCADEQQRKDELIDGLNRQNVSAKISDDWTFEFCLSKYGLFEECYEAIQGSREGIESIVGDDTEKATYIQSKVSKTDFAYNLSRILACQLEDSIRDNIEALTDDEKKDQDACEKTTNSTNLAFAITLKEKLPPYIVEAIEYVTAPIAGDAQNVEGAGNVEPT